MNDTPIIAALKPETFTYIELATARVLHSIEADGSTLYIIGNDGHAAYEWVYVRQGGQTNSDGGFGSVAAALFDGLKWLLG
jgi:hypothetical protein